MTLSTPSVRSALIGIAAVTLAAVLAVGLHLAAQAGQATRTAGDVLRAHAEAEAMALANQAGAPASPARIAAAFLPYAAADDGIERVLTDDAGTVYAASDADVGRAIDWAVVTRRAGGGRMAETTGRDGGIPRRGSARWWDRHGRRSGGARAGPHPGAAPRASARRSCGRSSCGASSWACSRCARTPTGRRRQRG